MVIRLKVAETANEVADVPAAAAGAEESEAKAFLDELNAQGHCEYSDKVIRFHLPDAEDHPPEDRALSG